jgi:maltose O-acetyltransferase
MPLKSLNLFLKPRAAAIATRNFWLQMRYGVELGHNVKASLSSRLAVRRRGTIRIGAETLLSFKTLIYSYDPVAKASRPVTIGKRCFIGGGSVIMPGVTIGDCVIIGAGSVVASDVPSRSLAVGNPAEVIRSDIEVGAFGRLTTADANARKYWK